MEHVDIKGPFVPSDYLQSVNGLWLMVSFCLPFLAAILLLPLLAFRAVPRVDGAPGVGRFLAWAVCAICLPVVIAGLAWMMYLILPRGTGLGWAILFIYAVPAVMVVSLALAIVSAVRSRLPRKAAAAQFALGASCLAYFAFVAIADFTKYAGLWLSLAASGLLAIGSAIDWFQCRPGAR
jgi:hypothetical protein